jgi:hypothetical protein
MSLEKEKEEPGITPETGGRKEYAAALISNDNKKLNC